MTSSEVPRRQRQGKPKVRTGCATCKARKVKCDETRPHCTRCVKFGRICEGYEPGQLRPADAPLLAIKPRPTATLTIYRPNSNISDDPDEQRYFHAYVEQVATDISGPFQSDFWYRIVPQAAQSESSIRYAATAITALMRTTVKAPNVSLRVDDHSVEDPHLKFALLQYTKAIQTLQARIKSNRPSHRILLIACLLFICIDVLQGDRVTALQQINGGLNVLCASRPWSNTLKPNVKKPWNPEPIEDELWQMLTNLNVHAYMLFSAQHPHHGPQYSEKERQLIYPPIPVRFQSVAQAKVSLDLVLSGVPMFHSRYPDDPLADQSIAADYNKRKEYEAHRKRLDCWEAAYEPLFRSITDGKSHVHYGEHILPIHHKLASIILEAGEYPEETIYDKLTQEFEFIVKRSRTIIEYRSKRHVNYLPKFSFEVGLLPSLHITALKCRDSRIRREAIELLYAYPQQEGLWTGRDSAKIGEWMMGLEEAEKDEDGFIPESARVKLVDMVYCHRQKKVWAQCQNVVCSPDGSFRKRDFEYPV